MKTQRGFAIVMAVFVLVVLALLGGYMLRFSRAEHYTPVLALQGAKAYQAAKAGLGWAMAVIHTGGNCASVSQTGFTIAGLSGFTVSISCTVVNYNESSSTPAIYTLTARSEYGSYLNPDYVSRNLTVKLCQGCA